MIKIKVLSGGYLNANTYLVYDEETMEGVVIDPASSYQLVENDSALINLKIKYILITHCHYDHIAYYEEWLKCTNAQSAIGIGDAYGLSNGAINLSPYFIINTKSFPKADILLQDQDVLTFGCATVHVIATPGHTTGSVCYYIGDILFSGDTIFSNGDVGRTDFPTGDDGDLKRSIAKLMQLPKKTAVFPGHGKTTTIGLEMKYYSV